MRGSLISGLFLLAGVAYAAKTLDIYSIDVEGGHSTLVVTPSGQSLLIDAGSAGFSGRDADRIAAAAKAAGVKRIDYLLITSFAKDRVGGVPNLMERLPVTNFLDAGGTYPDSYAAAIAKGVHKVIAAGESIPLKGVQASVPQAGVIVEFGKFRFGDFADPQNGAGKLDVYLSTGQAAESPQAIAGLAPRVTVITNAARKGGDPAGWKILKASPELEDLWQLHFAIAGGKDTNVPDSLIANVDENCTGKYIKVAASADGSFTVLNSRNKYMKTYGPL